MSVFLFFSSPSDSMPRAVFLLSLSLPLSLSLSLSPSLSLLQAREIMCRMGVYFQAQDDVLDCYGTFEQIGKDGTDIQEKKCGWLVIKALERCSPRQRKVIYDNYGQWNEAKVAKVKKVYHELKLYEVFEEYEEESFNELTEMIKKSTGVPKGVYQFMLDKTYKRKK